MIRLLSRFRLAIESADRRWLPALALRLLLCLLLMAPWDFKFTPQSFGPEDLDPRILARAKELGVDLLDPGQWPHVSGVLGRIALVAALMALSWWIISRLRIWIRLRFGAGAALTLLGLGSIAICFQGRFLDHAILFDGPPRENLPVWGGWVSSSLLGGGGLLFTAFFPMILVGLSELLLLLWSEQRRLEQAERLALSARMAPHFLFNALNTLRAKIEQDADAALGLTDRLSRVLRRLFQATAEPTVSLAQELELVDDYLGLEKARLGDRLRIQLEVPESLLSDHLPVLGLQVLVENAIKHGVASKSEGGEVRVEAHRDGRHLVVCVTDPGPGNGQGHGGEGGLGAALENLRRRLVRPGDLRMDLLPQGHVVTLRYPQDEVLA